MEVAFPVERLLRQGGDVDREFLQAGIHRHLVSVDFNDLRLEGRVEFFRAPVGDCPLFVIGIRGQDLVSVEGVDLQGLEHRRGFLVIVKASVDHDRLSDLEPGILDVGAVVVQFDDQRTAPVVQVELGGTHFGDVTGDHDPVSVGLLVQVVAWFVGECRHGQKSGAY